MADMSTNTQQVIECSQEFSNRSKSENTPVKAFWITPYSLPRPQTQAQTSPSHARYISHKTLLMGPQVRKSKKLRKGESTKNAI